MSTANLRALFADETSLRRLTSSTPPTVQNVSERTVGGRTVYEVLLEEEPADRIGQSLSAELVSLIGGIRADFVSYGPRHPVRRAIAEWDRACRRRHRLPSWRDHATPICGDLLRAHIEGGASVWWCSQQWSLPYPRAKRLIAAGLAFVEERVERADLERLGIVHDRESCAVCREDS